MSTITHLSPNEQAYVFIWRFKDIPHKQVYALQKDFYNFTHGKPELEEFDVVRLLEHRGTDKSAVELRKLVGDMLDQHTHKLSFIQLCCHVFEKPYRRFVFADDKSRDEAFQEASAEANDPDAAKARFLILQEVEEDALLKKKLDAEVKVADEFSGVAGKAAFFKKKMDLCVDEKKAIEMKVREEAAIRKAIKKAKDDEEEAARAAYRHMLEQEALEAERRERGYVELEPEPEPEPVAEEEPEPVVEEPTPEPEVENIQPVSDGKKRHYIGGRPISMKALKKRVMNVVDFVDDHVIVPLKEQASKLMKTEHSKPATTAPAGIAFNSPLSEEHVEGKEV